MTLPTSLIAEREVLYFFRQPNCAACAAAEPQLDAFEGKHPSVTIMRLDASGPFPERLGIKIKATPTYLFRRGGEGRMRAGMLSVKELETWLKSMEASL